MENVNQQTSKNYNRGQVISLEKGKLPPQATDLEEVVLGAMMIDKKGVDEIIDILNPDVFYKQSHQYIFEAIFKLFENSEPVDLLTVSQQLKKDQRKFKEAKVACFLPEELERKEHAKWLEKKSRARFG